MKRKFGICIGFQMCKNGARPVFSIDAFQHNSILKNGNLSTKAFRSFVSVASADEDEDDISIKLAVYCEVFV